MSWDIPDLFPPWGRSGEKPASDFEFTAGEQINEKYFNYLWAALRSLQNNLIDSLEDIDSDRDGVVDEADDADTVDGQDANEFIYNIDANDNNINNLNALDLNVLNTADVENAAAGAVPFAQGDGTLSMSQIDNVEVVEEEFTSSGTWDKPSGALLVIVDLFGGGGGGGGDVGAGGAGAARSRRLFHESVIDSSVTISIGAGGDGATNTDGNDATDGGTTTFGQFLDAAGGPRGAGDEDGGPPVPKNNQSGGNSRNWNLWDGGDGGPLYNGDGGSSYYACGGGGASGDADENEPAGNGGTPNAFDSGGDGGDGNNSGDGENGGFPGGGGGGGEQNGGDGGDGKATIITLRES